MRRFLLNLPSFLLIIYGLFVITAWCLGLPEYYKIYPSPAVFNTGLCFLLSGVALFCFTDSSFAYCPINAPPARKISLCSLIRIVLGCLIVLIATAIISQDIFAINLGIDQFFINASYTKYVPHPGRMMPSTAIAFILAGSVFIFTFKNWMARSFMALIIESIIYIIFLIGSISIISFVFTPELMYSLNSHFRMAPSAAVGFIILSLGLWFGWRQMPYSSVWYRGHEDRKIIFICSVILLIIALMSGFISFVSDEKQQIQYLGKSFQQHLEGRVNFFIANIDRVYSEINAIQENPLFQQSIKNSNTKNTQLQAVTKLFKDEGFTGVKIFDEKGNQVASSGEFIQGPEIQVPLNLPRTPVLLWKNDWYLDITVPISHDKTSPNHVLKLEWPLTDFGQSLINNLQVGPSEEYVVCTSASSGLANCFPSRLNSHVIQVSRMIGTQPTPIDLALKGKKGVISSYDFRGQRVLAAYSPVDHLNLGMVLKIDLTDVYRPFMRNMNIIFPIIFIAIVIGMVILRSSLKPLMQKILKSEKELMSSNKLLRESQERYELAVIGSQAGLWDWQIGSKEIFYSPQLKKMLGYKNHQLANTIGSIETLMHPDDLLLARKALADHIKYHIPYNLEYRLRNKKGNYLWFAVRGQALWDANGLAVRMAGSFTDITGQKKKQQLDSTQYHVTKLLSESQTLEEVNSAMLRQMCEGMLWQYGGIWLVDKRINKLRNIDVWHVPSKKLEELKKFSKKIHFGLGEGLPGKVWATGHPCSINNSLEIKELLRIKHINIENLQAVFCFPIVLGFQVLGAMEFFSYDKKPPDAQTLKTMESIGSQIGQFIQSKNMENDLRASEAHTSAILESAYDSIITLDDFGTIISSNSQAEKMFGYSIDELIGKNLNELVPDLTAKLKKLENNPPKEFQIVRSNSDTFPAEISISGMIDNDQHQYVVIIRDITERKKMESLKNEFVSVVSHELRTPLTSIRGSLSLILGGAVGAFSEKANKLLKIAENNCDRLLVLINDILDIEKIEAGKMVFNLKPVDINLIIANAIESNQLYADKFNVKLKLVQSAPGILVNVDSDRLMQVLTNLISNAAKFSPEGGEVTISVEQSNDHVRVSIHDNGAGIPEDFKAKIFTKFSQADTRLAREKGGTGLGLSISHILIEKFDGRLDFISEPNQGTTFYFELPTWHKDKQQKRVDAQGMHLLVCDDDKDQARYLQTLLQSAGYDTETAYSADQAMHLLVKKPYDALLLDLFLPGKSGIELIKELRADENLCSLPIIVISVICEAGRDLINGEAVSVIDWLDKPIDYMKLLGIIQALKKKNDNHRPHILHIEDDKDLSKIVSGILQDEASIKSVGTLQEGRNSLTHENFDLVILDLLLPDGNGTELLPLLSQKGLPVVVFSTVELNHNFEKYVSEVLLKSQTSNEELLSIIKNILNQSKIKDSL